VEYRESIFVGYRYYDTAGKTVRFPFGYGLSYTDFAYSAFHMDQTACEYGDKVTVTFCITNKGKTAAKETTFLFASHENSKVFLPKKELKGFIKTELLSGETKQVSLTLDTADLSYYNTIIRDWYAESGAYTIMVGPSSDQCCYSEVLKLRSPEKPQPDLREKAPAYYHLSKEELLIPEREFEAVYGAELPVSDSKPSRPYDLNNSLDDVSHTLFGKIIIHITNSMAKKMTKSTKEEEAMMAAMIREMPLHSMAGSSDGVISEMMLMGILDLFNGHYLRGIKKLVKGK
jgi:beta-glucosidase